jgi:hypothetical protein
MKCNLGSLVVDLSPYLYMCFPSASPQYSESVMRWKQQSRIMIFFLFLGSACFRRCFFVPNQQRASLSVCNSSIFCFTAKEPTRCTHHERAAKCSFNSWGGDEHEHQHQLTTTTQSYQEAVGLCRDVAIERER